MRKSSFLIGLLCGSLLFGGVTVFANAEIVAKITSQIFFWNNQKVELEAYNINGSNYVKLRDAAELFGVNIEYYEDTNTVYLGESRKESSPKTTIDGNSYAKEDYSLKANPGIFNEIYTRDAYNAIRQSIVDIAEITENTDENGYNADYEYAHFVDNGIGKTIDLPNDYSYACVFASDHQNYYGLSDVFVEYSIFPLGYHAIMIYDGVNADGTYLQSDEFDTIIYKKLNEIVLNEEFFNMMEVLSYNSFADCFGDAWIRFVYTDEDGKNYSPPIDDVQNHQLLCVYPQAREFVNECLDLHNKYILSHWGNIAAPIGFEDEKAEFDNFVDAKEKLSKIWFEWSEIDTRVKRNTYIQLIKKHFANKNGISTGIIDDYFNNNEDLLSCLGNFIDNELWPQNIIQELDAKLESLSRIET